MMVDLTSCLELAREAASEAAMVAMSGYRQGTTAKKKGRIDLVTEYDLRCEELLRSKISEAFPEHRIVGEEFENQAGGDDAVWYIDPIDGTTNFAHGHPFFAVSIGLWIGGEAALGVVSAPALRCSWWATRGGGAFRNQQRIQVSDRDVLQDALCATGFPYDRQTSDENNFEEAVAFLRRSRGVRRCGSASIDLCLVADGTYDFYWEQKLSPWDMCAGALIVEEAGGKLTDYDGGIADPRQGRIVASNGAVHEEGLALLQEIRG